MRADRLVSSWSVGGAAFHRGGRRIVHRSRAPLGQVLPYRRACGESPSRTAGADEVRRRGWTVPFRTSALGDLLLGLALVRALADTSDSGIRYTGPRASLLERCALAMEVRRSPGPQVIRTDNPDPVAFQPVPENPPTWLDLLDHDRVEIHAALPMRYYLAAELRLGERLPADQAPAPTFRSGETARPFQVVFVGATSWADRKDYGAAGFVGIVEALRQRRDVSWQFSLVPGQRQDSRARAHVAAAGVCVLPALADTDCLDLFASAELVIGNDTGLTHLAALTARGDGTGPHVVGLYGRHAYSKWTTGNDRHHAVATPFSQMLAAADRCPVRDHLDDALWSSSADIAGLPARAIAEFAGHQAGWW